MDFSKINKVGRMEHFLPTKKITELNQQKTYKVTNIKLVNTKFGERIVASIEGEFNIFLPARIAKNLQEDEQQMELLNKAIAENVLHLRYLGGKYNNCEFSASKQNE